MSTLNLREIVVIAFLSAVFGVLYLVWIFVNQILTGITGPAGAGLMKGLWLMAPIICMVIIQKPGVALAAEMIAAFTEIMVGSVNAGTVLLLGFTQGLGAEMMFAMFRYRIFTLPVLMLAGMAGTMANVITLYFIYGYSQYAPPVFAFMVITALLSGAIFGGWASRSLAYTLVRTGVLHNFALGKEYQKKKMEKSAS
ncbi:ECF transporter S component [Alteribacillus iranensis]|uniref:Energy-coupling factor transport system substrate-specific component n=1 Tax=Alteribacillus iranensis TaxID=930128 RepID=A0A1I2BMR4_9BACI|nr:ECF transporter S component [Alteribacillus iranensis]SFE57217.1 energy-coupling factor transport system substrate-specific component [Alteribacillus iranensis]